MRESVSYEPSGRVAVVTIRRAERRNAVDAATAAALADAFRRFDADDNAFSVNRPLRCGATCG